MAAPKSAQHQHFSKHAARFCLLQITDLGQEMENGRLLRLLVKLAQVVDRPEAPGMPSWSETGHR